MPLARVIGPLGRRGFCIPENLGSAILVGGGIGLPPLIFLAQHLAQRSITGVVIAGAASRTNLPLTLLPKDKRSGRLHCEEFDRSGFDLLVATEDGSVGKKGLATDLLRECLAGGEVDMKRATVFACGPWAMLAAATSIAEQFGLRCQVCLEQIMGCGMGTCQSCVVEVKAANSAEGKRYALVCDEGPVFDGNDVIWQDQDQVTWHTL